MNSVIVEGNFQLNGCVDTSTERLIMYGCVIVAILNLYSYDEGGGVSVGSFVCHCHCKDEEGHWDACAPRVNSSGWTPRSLAAAYISAALSACLVSAQTSSSVLRIAVSISTPRCVSASLQISNARLSSPALAQAACSTPRLHHGRFG